MGISAGTNRVSLNANPVYRLSLPSLLVDIGGVDTCITATGTDTTETKSFTLLGTSEFVTGASDSGVVFQIFPQGNQWELHIVNSGLPRNESLVATTPRTSSIGSPYQWDIVPFARKAGIKSFSTTACRSPPSSLSSKVATIKITPQEYYFGPEVAMIISPTPNPPFTLGDPAFFAAHIIFDRANNLIGIAEQGDCTIYAPRSKKKKAIKLGIGITLAVVGGVLGAFLVGLVFANFYSKQRVSTRSDFDYELMSDEGLEAELRPMSTT